MTDEERIVRALGERPPTEPAYVVRLDARVPGGGSPATSRPRQAPATATWLMPAVGALAALVLLGGVYVMGRPVDTGAGVPTASGVPSLLAATLAPTGVARNGRIVYESGGDIWVVAPDGTDPQRLTAFPGRDFDPVWSPDGTWIAYWSGDTRTLHVMRPDGSEDMVIHHGITAGPPVDWAPDSGRLAWGALVGRQLPGIEAAALDLPDKPWVVAEDGALPAWSPDGRAVAFVGGGGVTDAAGFLSLVAADGSQGRTISRVLYRAMDQPRWSPDGRSIAFAAGDSDADRRIYLLDVAGGFERRVSSTDGDEWDPRWSPDGRRLAFLRRTDGRSAAIVMTDASGGGETLIETGLGATHVSWAPDGTQLLVTVEGLLGQWTDLSVVDVASGEQVWEMRVDSTGVVPDWQRLAP